MNSPRKDASPMPRVLNTSPFKASPKKSPRKWRAEGRLETRAEGKAPEVLQNLQWSNSRGEVSPKRKRESRGEIDVPGKTLGALGSAKTSFETLGPALGSSSTRIPALGPALGPASGPTLGPALGASTGSSGTGPSAPARRFHRPALPTLPRPLSRSATSLATLSSPPKPAKLRRAASSLSSADSSISDRFIPSYKNPTSNKLTATSEAPHPNASPRTHIKAQTSKIYQHHVAEACGLTVNSRILSYRPLPPDRSKPLDLFSHLGSSTGPQIRSLRPSLASERAKKIPSAPERVLDAPNIVDDFYLNLIAWSSTNLIVIGLEDAVYVWNASSGSVGLLCETAGCLITSLRWSEDGSYISIGKDDGCIEIWDIETNARLRTLATGTAGRIAAHTWSAHMLTAGSKEGVLSHSDVRVSQHLVGKRENAHVAEVCGVEFRSDGSQFCSGGNDNVVAIWDARNMGGEPIFTKNTHRAAVKALSWCPYQSSLLATGGGTSDKSIHFWNTSTGARVHSIETESQISSLNWGYAKGTGYEMVVTHGYPSNSISLFNYPTLQKTGEISHAHDSRILNGCISPDRTTLATVSGDENLKFWSLFDEYKAPVDEKEERHMQKLMSLR